MSIVRQHQRDKGFASIDNRTIRDRALSFKAVGILAHLLSLPDGAACSAEALADSKNRDGVKAIRAGFDELEERGYLERRRLQDEGGRWATEIHVYERPETARVSAGTKQMPLTDAPKRPVGLTRANGNENVNPQVAPTSHLPIVGEGSVKDLKTFESKDLEPKALKHTPARARDSRFDEFWSHYPRKEDKSDARKAWDKRIKAGAEEEALIEGARAFGAWCVAALAVGELESKRFIKLPATWLNKGAETNVLHMPGRAPAAASKFERARQERRLREVGTA